MKTKSIFFVSVACAIIVYGKIIWTRYYWHGILDFNIFNYDGFWVGVGAIIVFIGLTYLMKIWDRIFKKKSDLLKK